MELELPIFHHSDNTISLKDMGIDLLSLVEGKKYTKNEKILQNTYFKGIPDIFTKNSTKKKYTEVLDIKVCLDFNAFMGKKYSKVSPEHYWQMQGYMDIMKLDKATLVYTLPDMHPKLLNTITGNAMSKWLANGIDNSVILSRMETLRNSCIYDNISKEDRVYKVIVERNDFDIKRARQRVPVIRSYFNQLLKEYPQKIC